MDVAQRVAHRVVAEILKLFALQRVLKEFRKLARAGDALKLFAGEHRRPSRAKENFDVVFVINSLIGKERPLNTLDEMRAHARETLALLPNIEEPNGSKVRQTADFLQ